MTNMSFIIRYELFLLNEHQIFKMNIFFNSLKKLKV